jgi:hypothetical protein
MSPFTAIDRSVAVVAVRGLCSRQGSALVLSGTLLFAGSATRSLDGTPQVTTRTSALSSGYTLLQESPASTSAAHYANGMATSQICFWTWIQSRQVCK